LRGPARVPRLAPAQEARLLGPFGFTVNAGAFARAAVDRKRQQRKARKHPRIDCIFAAPAQPEERPVTTLMQLSF